MIAVLWVCVAIIVAAGLLTGLTIRNVVQRRGGTLAEAARNQRLAIGIAMLVGAVILGIVAATDQHHRFANLVVAAYLAFVAMRQFTRFWRTGRKLG